MTQEEPRPLRQVDPTVARDLDTIIHTAIARDPKDRYATAAELRDELELSCPTGRFARGRSRRWSGTGGGAGAIPCWRWRALRLARW
jgi:hypothetical protein